jgi:hypothetical protein
MRLSERQRLVKKIDALTDAEIAAVLDYIALIEGNRNSAAGPPVWDDELLTMLSEARENRRARQAFAWEALRRRAERQIVLSGSRT